jgi:predicted site-specific integrase-resolvase
MNSNKEYKGLVPKKQQDLEFQHSTWKFGHIKNGYKIDSVYKDISSGLSFYERKDFLSIVNQVIQGKVEKVIITYKDRFSRIGFDFFKILFEKFSCEIEVISEVGSYKIDSDEIFEEIIHLLHCYSMKLYSKRRKKNVKDLCNPII